MVWAAKRDAGLWFAAAEQTDKRVGIQVLPITPFLARLFPDPSFNRQVVQWVLPVLGGDGTTDEWRGFAWALQATYDPAAARENIEKLTAFDDGNSKTNMLWLQANAFSWLRVASPLGRQFWPVHYARVAPPSPPAPPTPAVPEPPYPYLFEPVNEEGEFPTPPASVDGPLAADTNADNDDDSNESVPAFPVPDFSPDVLLEEEASGPAGPGLVSKLYL
ncbi:unnamed protein product [Closterium sp. Naga37s-1]|nr:unnamed protein product [Closterium sp. Naga37s-1]